MTWICEKCNGKNNNSSSKCRINKCHTPKPIKIIEEETKRKGIVRDYCPKCKAHRDFKRVKGKTYSCPGCKKRFKLVGDPIPEEPILVAKIEEEIEKQGLKF